MREDEVEAAARAIVMAQGHDPDADWAEWKPNLPERPPEPAWKTCRAEAREAILAVDRLRRQAAPRESAKAVAGATKVPLHLVPPTFKLHVSLAMAWGARRYAPYDWRDPATRPVRASTYVAAMHRHLDSWASGEDAADDSGVDHLAHLAASCAILMDARAAGRLDDDRARLDLAGERAAAEAVMARWVTCGPATAPA